MKITRMGMIPKPETLTTTCGHCKTEFEFTTDEIARLDFHYDEGPRSTWAEVRCPLCKRTVIHPLYKK